MSCKLKINTGFFGTKNINNSDYWAINLNCELVESYNLDWSSKVFLDVNG